MTVTGTITFLICFFPAVTTSIFLYRTKSRMKDGFSKVQNDKDIPWIEFHIIESAVNRWAFAVNLSLCAASWIEFSNLTNSAEPESALVKLTHLATSQTYIMMILLLVLPCVAFYSIFSGEYFLRLSVGRLDLVEPKRGVPVLLTILFYPFSFFIFARKTKNKIWRFSAYQYLLPLFLFFVLGITWAGMGWPKESSSIFAASLAAVFLTWPIAVFHASKIGKTYAVLTATPEMLETWTRLRNQEKAAQEERNRKNEEARQREERKAAAEEIELQQKRTEEARRKAEAEADAARKSRDERNQQRAPNSKQDTVLCFAELGISPGASESEIKKAYREMLKQYHPDKFASLTPEFQKVASDKTRLIIDSYNECLKKLAS
jgi:hypothetical protein